MSVKVSSRVWERSRATLGARLVLIYLADCAHDDGSNIYPSIPTIAKNTRLSDRQVQRQIKHLIEIGELVDEGRSLFGTRQFRIVIPEMSPRHIVTPDINDTKTAEGVTDRAESNVENVTQSVRRDPEDQKTVDPPNQNETSGSTVEWTDAPWLLKFLKEQHVFNGTRLPKLLDYGWWSDLSQAVNGVDLPFVTAEFGKMGVWLRDNPARAPTDRGVRRFVASWLERAASRRRNESGNQNSKR